MEYNFSKYKLYEKVNFFKKNYLFPSFLVLGDLKSTNSIHITIAIPTFNRHELLKQAIQSAIYQKSVSFSYEILVVDNANSDGQSNETFKVVKELSNEANNIIYYQNSSNLGMIGNWNRCIELARGKWIAFLHDDDLLVDDYLFRINEFLKVKKNIDCILPSFLEFKGFNSPKVLNLVDTSKTQKFNLIRLKSHDSLIWASNPYKAPTCGTILNRSLAIEVGGFDDSLFPASDWFFLLKFGHYNNLYKMNWVSGYYRWLGNETFKTETLQNFIKIRHSFRLFCKNTYFFSWIIFLFFKNEQYLIYSKFIIGLNPSLDLKISDFNHIFKPRVSLIKLKIYTFLVKFYWKIKRNFSYSFNDLIFRSNLSK